MYLDLETCFHEKLECNCEFRSECPLYHKLITSKTEYERSLLATRLSALTSNVDRNKVDEFTEQHDTKRKILLSQLHTITE